MSKEYVSIHKDQTGQLDHLIFSSQNKTTAKNWLRDQKLTPKLVLTLSDLENIKLNQFQNKDLTETLRSYALEHIPQWEAALLERSQSET